MILWLLRSFYQNPETCFIKVLKTTYQKVFDIPLTKTDDALIEKYNAFQRITPIKNKVFTIDNVFDKFFLDRELELPNLTELMVDYQDEFQNFSLFHLLTYIIERYALD